MFNLEKGSFDQRKPPAFGDAPRGFAYVIVSFPAMAAVTYHQNSAFHFISHSKATASLTVAGVQ
jgi:hypothetical protein